MPSVAEVEKWTLRRFTLLINLLIVRLRDLPFAVDHIGVHKSNYACGWTTCVQRGQPQTSRFALMSHIQSHADQTGSDFITDFSFQVPPSPESEPVFDYPDEKGPDSSITNSVFVPPSTPQLESVFDYSAFDSAAKEETSDAAQTIWEDILMKQLREEEDLFAESAKYFSQESAWILSLRRRLLAEEDKVSNAVASSSSSSYTRLDRKEIPG